MKKFTWLLIFLLLAGIGFAQNNAPTVLVNTFEVDFGSEVLTIDFDVNDTESDPIEVSFLFSEDGGQTFTKFSVNSLSATPPLNNGSYVANWNYQNKVADITQTIIRIVANDDKLPQPCDLANEVDTNNLKNWVTWFQGPRNYNVDSARINMIKDSLANYFIHLGLTTNRVNFTLSGRSGENIIGQKSGLWNSPKTLLVDAHFDAVPVSPGADDNASGMAAVLEAARIMTEYQFAQNIEFVGFDLEEEGLLGSRNYAGNIAASKEIIGVLNFEMIGYFTNQPNTQILPTGFGSLFPTQTAAIIADSSRGNFITNVYNNSSAGLGSTYFQQATNCVSNLKIISLEVPGNGSLVPDLRRSDHAPFWDKNLPALMLTDGANFRNMNYHTTNDSISTLNFKFMKQTVSAAVAAAVSLAEPSHGTSTDINLSLVETENHHHENCEVKVYPNPVKDVLEVFLGECFDSQLLIEVYDLEGKKSFQEFRKTQSKNISVNVNKLKSGSYVLVITSKHEQQSMVFQKS